MYSLELNKKELELVRDAFYWVIEEKFSGWERHMSRKRMEALLDRISEAENNR